MDDLQLLHRAIIANPLDDTPRLMYADWLDEQGGPENADHALYIRTAIESESVSNCAHMTPHGDDCRSCQLDDLLQWFSYNPENRQERAWRPHQWYTVGDRNLIEVATYWHRGFVHTVDMVLPVGDFIKHAHEFAVFPLKHVRIRSKYPHYNSYAADVSRSYTWDDRGDASQHAHVVPKKLWDPKILTPSVDYEEALAKFSQVCINYIRKKAALTKRG